MRPVGTPQPQPERLILAMDEVRRAQHTARMIFPESSQSHGNPMNKIQEKYDARNSMFAIDAPEPDKRPCDLAVCQKGAPWLFIIIIIIRILAIIMS